MDGRRVVGGRWLKFLNETVKEAGRDGNGTVMVTCQKRKIYLHLKLQSNLKKRSNR